MAKNAKRPRPAKRRTLPPDATSLIAMIRVVHRQLRDRAEHLKQNAHDYHARRGFQALHDQRSAAWMALYANAPNSALALAAELDVKLPTLAQSPTREQEEVAS